MAAPEKDNLNRIFNGLGSHCGIGAREEAAFNAIKLLEELKGKLPEDEVIKRVCAAYDDYLRARGIEP